MKYRVKVMRRDHDERICVAQLSCDDVALATEFANAHDGARVEVCLAGSDERLHWIYLDQIS